MLVTTTVYIPVAPIMGVDVVPPDTTFGPAHEYVTPGEDVADNVTLLEPHGIKILAATVGTGATVVPYTVITVLFEQPVMASVIVTV